MTYQAKLVNSSNWDTDQIEVSVLGPDGNERVLANVDRGAAMDINEFYMGLDGLHLVLRQVHKEDAEGGYKGGISLITYEEERAEETFYATIRKLVEQVTGR